MPALFLPFYFLKKDFIVRHGHKVFALNFGLAFASLFSLFLKTDYFEVYMMCAFLVPFMGSLISTQSVKLFMFYPVIFYAQTLFYFNKILNLNISQIYFFSFYSISMFSLIAFVVHYNFMNKVRMQELQNAIRDSLEDKSSLVRILTHDISNVLTVLGMNFSILDMFHKKSDIPKNIARSSEIINKSIYSLAEITDKVKEMESIDGGKKGVELKPTNIGELMQVSCEFYKINLMIKM